MLKKELEYERRQVISLLKTVIQDSETFKDPQVLAASILKHVFNEEI